MIDGVADCFFAFSEVIADNMVDSDNIPTVYPSPWTTVQCLAGLSVKQAIGGGFTAASPPTVTSRT